MFFKKPCCTHLVLLATVNADQYLQEVNRFLLVQEACKYAKTNGTLLAILWYL